MKISICFSTSGNSVIPCAWDFINFCAFDVYYVYTVRDRQFILLTSQIHSASRAPEGRYYLNSQNTHLKRKKRNLKTSVPEIPIYFSQRLPGTLQKMGWSSTVSFGNTSQQELIAGLSELKLEECMKSLRTLGFDFGNVTSTIAHAMIVPDGTVHTQASLLNSHPYTSKN